MKKILFLALLAPIGCSGMASMSERIPAQGAEPGAPPQGTPPARVREFFPESLLWRPEVVTDEKGQAALHFPAADSITTWRISAIANTARGDLGYGGATFRVFQKFFVEPDLPPVLTQGDRIQMPVAIYNFLEREQRVVVGLVPDDWYELAGESEQVVKLAARQVASVKFGVVALRLGTHAIRVEARGETEGADVVQRNVTVWPDGRERTNVVNATVSGRTTLSLEVPAGAIPGTARLVCKCYPGVLGSMLDGLEGMLRHPHG